MHAVGRIAYRGSIDSIQVSWVKMGAEGVRQLLCSGANDLGGTLMDENISRAAGASHGQGMDRAGFAAVVAPLGRPLVQRTTLYSRVPVASPCERRRHHRAHQPRRPRDRPPRRAARPRGLEAAFELIISAVSLLQQAELLRSMLATVWELGVRARAPATSRSPTQPLPRWPRPSGVPPLPLVRKVTMFGSARTKPADPSTCWPRTWPRPSLPPLDGGHRCRAGHHGAGSEARVVTMPSG